MNKKTLLFLSLLQYAKYWGTSMVIAMETAYQPGGDNHSPTIRKPSSGEI